MGKANDSRGARTNRRKVLLHAALNYADLGVPVFPVHSVLKDGTCTCGGSVCDSAGKHPVTGNGHKEATTDHDQIKRWWSKRAWNIGAVPGYAGCAVLDIDLWKEGEEDRLKEVERIHGELPLTFTVLTGQHGDERGRHYWFKVPEGIMLPRKVGGIDLRSGETYVLMPPSRHKSAVEYEAESGDLSYVPDAPRWILDAGSNGQRKESGLENRTRTGVKTGKRTKAALASNTLPPPEDGQSHRDVAVGIARNLYETGTPADVVVSIMTSMLENPTSSLDPARPWEVTHAKDIVRSVVSMSAPDSAKFVKASGPFELTVSTLDDARELARTPIDWVIPGVIAKGDKALVAGPPKAYKTWLVLHIARCVACAEPLFGHSDWTPAEPAGVLLIQEEGAPHHWGRRLELVFGTEADHPVYYSHRSGINLLDEGHVDALIAEAKSREVGLIVIDPFQRVTAGVNENDAADTGPVWDSIHRISRETGAATLVVHHARKHDGEPGMDSIRGSSRMAGEVDFMTVQMKSAPGQLDVYIDGRDLVLDGDTNYLSLNFPKDEPHKMRLVEMKVLPHERAKSIGHLALRELKAAQDWMTTNEVARAVADDFGKMPTSQAVTDAVHKLVEEEKVEKQQGARNKLSWRYRG
jgi:hypothetical protein